MGALNLSFHVIFGIRRHRWHGINFLNYLTFCFLGILLFWAGRIRPPSSPPKKWPRASEAIFWSSILQCHFNVLRALLGYFSPQPLSCEASICYNSWVNHFGTGWVLPGLLLLFLCLVAEPVQAQMQFPRDLGTLYTVDVIQIYR